MDEWAVLEQVASGCIRCPLGATRTRVVLDRGSRDAKVLLVGEAPGAAEDAAGRPFVGAAGRLLDRELATAGIGQEEILIVNTVNCRPPGNRTPSPAELAACRPYLTEQLRLAGPRLVVALGTTAAVALWGHAATIRGLRSSLLPWHGRQLAVTFHPAAALRNGQALSALREDLALVRAQMI